MSTAMLTQLIQLSSDSGVSLQLQLRKQIADAIIRGKFPNDTPLPSSRKLSQQLRVARNTVVLAYQHLEDDGYLVAKERRGYFVNPAVLKGRAHVREAHDDEDPAIQPDWPHIIKSTQSSRQNISKPNDWQKYQYPFIYGQFDADLFPTHHWRECCRDSVTDGGIRDWASDHYVRDDPKLIDEIRLRILPRRGIWVDEDQIMITVGTQQALYILGHMLLDETSVLAVEDPGYTDLRNIAALNGCSLLPLPIDEQGLIVDQSLEQCDCVFVTPSHQSPTTVTMPIERRKKLLDLATEHNFMVIEDDYECETNFAAAHTPALKSLDKHGRVIYTGSFSKILAPGLRLGYMVASKEVIKEAMALRRLMVRHPPANNQRSVALFIERGYYDALAAKLLKEYESRWRVMADALARHLPESSSTPTFGGTSFWVRGPAHIDASKLQEIAKKNSLIIETGRIHYFEENPPLNFFRLGYSSIKIESIEPGIRLLAQLINDYQQLIDAE